MTARYGNKSPHAKLAKHASEQYIRHGRRIAVPTMTIPELRLQRACYIFVFENPGETLRSMYGAVLPSARTLAEEIIGNTIHAVQHTFRKVDLPYLSYTVAVLDPLERITIPEHLDPHHYGLYIRTDSGKKAILLPGRTGIETAEDQMATALREAEIDPHREVPSFYRFRVTYHG